MNRPGRVSGPACLFRPDGYCLSGPCGYAVDFGAGIW